MSIVQHNSRTTPFLFQFWDVFFILHNALTFKRTAKCRGNRLRDLKD